MLQADDGTPADIAVDAVVVMLTTDSSTGMFVADPDDADAEDTMDQVGCNHRCWYVGRYGYTTWMKRLAHTLSQPHAD